MISGAIPPYLVKVITLLLLLATASSQAESELFRHPKLIEINETVFSNSDGASTLINNAYIIELNNAVNSVRLSTSHLIASTIQDGGNVTYMFKHIFRGFSVRGMSSLRMQEILDSPLVHSAERAYVSRISSIKTQKKAIWNLDMLTKLYTDKTYKYKYTGTGVRVYVLDTGLDYTHKEFGKRATCGWDAFKSDCKDIHGHGTHVAGTIGSKKYGVAKDVLLVGVKTFDDTGNGKVDDIYNGIEWVVKEKLRNPKIPMVINMSNQVPKSTKLNKSVNSATRKGITVVVAAGNDRGKDACNVSPASAKGAITVGSISSNNNEVSGFSNGGKCVDIMAPGEGIKSVLSCAKAGVTPWKCQFWIQKSGTSFATPLVAGVAALHLHKNNSLTPAGVRRAILYDARWNVIKDINNYKVPNVLVSAVSILK